MIFDTDRGNLWRFRQHDYNLSFNSSTVWMMTIGKFPVGRVPREVRAWATSPANYDLQRNHSFLAGLQLMLHSFSERQFLVEELSVTDSHGRMYTGFDPHNPFNDQRLKLQKRTIRVE